MSLNIQWTYTTGSLRIKENSSRHFHHSSACVLAQGKDCYILSVSPLLALDVTVDITTRKAIDSSKIYWYPLTVVEYKVLSEIDKFLDGFTELYDQKPEIKYFSVLKFRHKSHSKIFSEFCKKAWNPINSFDNVKGKSIQVLSSSFGLVNPAIFSEYRSSGTLSYIATRNKKVIAMLSEIRFLDGMESGIVEMSKLMEVPTLGLVGGSLCRKGGEGSLTVILPWRLIIEPFIEIAGLKDDRFSPPSCGAQMYPTFDYGLNSHIPKQIASKESNDNFDLCNRTVIALTVSKPGNWSVWGSGVVIDHNTIVTNEHVIGDSQLSIKGWISHTEYVNLKLLGVPIRGIDMVFLQICEGSHSNSLRPAIIQDILPPRGSYVKSIGYGLFYPKHVDSPLCPLICQGVISSLVNMKLTSSQQTTLPVMLVSTAACWNGSSGGAVVNAQGEVIGIMASNGKMNDSGGILPEMAFVIPSPLLLLGKKLLDASQTIEISTHVRRLWHLQETHADVMADSPRL